MAEETKTKAASPSPAKSDSDKKASAPKAEGSMNGKGDAPRNCFSDSYRSNFEQIDWSK